MRIHQNSNLHTQKQNQEPIKPSHRQSFKGGFDSVIIGTMDAIERGGLFASFTMQDFLGTILPRPLAGLTRNQKENNGKKNTKFALKEIIRETTSGPSMFVIPLLILTPIKKFVGKALDVPTNFIKGLGDIYKNNISPEKITDASKMKLDYYIQAFKNVLSTSTGKPVDEISEQAEKMAQSLLDMETSEKTPFIKQLKGDYIPGTKQFINNQLADDFTTLIKQTSNNASTDFLTASITKDGEKISAPFKKVITYISDYADDAINKTLKNHNTVNNLKEFIENFNNKRICGRFAINAIMTVVVTSFLAIVPKLYNMGGKENPALIGLDASKTVPTADNNEKPEVKGDNKNANS